MNNTSELKVDIQAKDNTKAGIDKSKKSLGKFVKDAGQLVGGVAVIGGQFTKEFHKIEKGQEQVANVLGKSTKQIEKEYSASIKKLAKDTGQPLEQVWAGLYDVVSAGYEGDEAFKVLRKSAELAYATNSDFASSNKLLLNTLVDNNAEIGNLDEVTRKYFAGVSAGRVTGNDMNTIVARSGALARSAGLDYEDLAVAVSTFSEQGIPAAEVGTQLNGFLRDVAKGGGKEFNAAMREGGYTVADLKKAMGEDGLVGVSRILNDVQEKTGVNWASVLPESAGMFATIVSQEYDSIADKTQKVSEASSTNWDNAMTNMEDSSNRKTQAVQNDIQDLEAGAGKFFTKMGGEYVVAAMRPFEEMIGLIVPGYYAGKGAVSLLGSIGKLRSAMVALNAVSFAPLIAKLVALIGKIKLAGTTATISGTKIGAIGGTPIVGGGGGKAATAAAPAVVGGSSGGLASKIPYVGTAVAGSFGAKQAFEKYRHTDEDKLRIIQERPASPLAKRYREELEMAEGGIVTKPTRALIGEAGPEAVIPLNKAGGVGTTVNVYVEGSVITENELAQHIDEVMTKRLHQTSNFPTGFAS